MTEDEMVGWHHQFNGHEFAQALGVDGGQGSLACWHGVTKSGHDLGTEKQQQVGSEYRTEALVNYL